VTFSHRIKVKIMCNTFRQAVSEIYDWVDEQIAIANPRCEISGRCCRFREYGHKLYITRPEAELLLEKEVPKKNSLVGLSEKKTYEQVNEVCPYQDNGLCTARENRPLSCRIYFCDPNHEEKASQITEQALKLLKDLHETSGVPWEYHELSYFFLKRSS